MPNFIISGIPGVDVGPDAARATVEKRIANEIAESEKATRLLAQEAVATAIANIEPEELGQSARGGRDHQKQISDRIYWALQSLTENNATQRIARQIAEELKDASAAVDATAAGRKGESRVMVAYMNATNNQNAIQEIQRERTGA